MNKIINLCNDMLASLPKERLSGVDLFQRAVYNRLNKSFNSFLHDLDIAEEYLSRRKPIKLMRKISKYER